MIVAVIALGCLYAFTSIGAARREFLAQRALESAEATIENQRTLLVMREAELRDLRAEFRRVSAENEKLRATVADLSPRGYRDAPKAPSEAPRPCWDCSDRIGARFTLASAETLDALAWNVGIARRPGEHDADFRARVVNETNGWRTNGARS